MLNNDQMWTLAIGVLLGLSELMGMFKRGPNGILHAVWKFYNIKVEVEYLEEGEGGGDGVRTIDERLDQSVVSNRETIVMENGKAEGSAPNVLLINKIA